MCTKSACFDPGTRQPDQFSCEMFYFFSGEAILGVANGENGGNGSPSNGFCGTNGGIGGLAIGLGSQTNGENGQNGGVAVGARSDANGGGVALNGGNTNGISGGIALNGGQGHLGCNVAIGNHCLNVPGRQLHHSINRINKLIQYLK